MKEFERSNPIGPLHVTRRTFFFTCTSRASSLNLIPSSPSHRPSFNSGRPSSLHRSCIYQHANIMLLIGSSWLRIMATTRTASNLHYHQGESVEANDAKIFSENYPYQLCGVYPASRSSQGPTDSRCDGKNLPGSAPDLQHLAEVKRIRKDQHHAFAEPLFDATASPFNTR
jgi:hypothetical protein